MRPTTAPASRARLLRAGCRQATARLFGQIKALLLLIGSLTLCGLAQAGQSNILWQKTSGERAIWNMNDAALTSGAAIANVDPSWSIAASADFNGDGQPDIVWQNIDTGDRAIWFMNGSTVVSGVGFTSVSTAWTIAGAADFNGDGKPDLLWQHTSGSRAIWLMNGTTLTGAVGLGSVPSNWSIAGTGDFDADGRTDIVWQSTSGERVIWYLNGTTATSGRAFATVDPAWSIAGAGDFDNDGRADLVWQHGNGDRAIWFMNGRGIVRTANLGRVDPSWRIAAVSPHSIASSLAAGMRLIVDTLASCFQQPAGARVLSTDTTIPTNQGGPAVTGFGGKCQEITHPGFLANGYSTGQRFYGRLLDPAMDGAVFLPADLMLFIDDTTSADRDKAVVNLRFIDANGVAGNLIEVAEKIPGSATAGHPSDWWLYGNQYAVDTSLSAFVRRNEQHAPNPGTGTFVNASTSRFETGFSVFINKDGPGSSGLRAARIFGPGLPPAGLVYTRPDPAIVSDQNWLNIRRKDGRTDPASATLSGDIGNIFRIHRTVGLSGSDATTTRANPNAGNADNTSFPGWAHPLDYGAAVGTSTTSYIDFSSLKANTSYTFELYYDGETAPRHTLVRTLLTPVLPATFAHNLEWLALTGAARRYLDPADPLAAPQSTMDVGWTAYPFAETVRSCGVYTYGGGVSIARPTVNVVPGATTCTASAPSGSTFPALTSDGSSGRSFQLRYQMLDGSFKDSTSRFN